MKSLQAKYPWLLIFEQENRMGVAKGERVLDLLVEVACTRCSKVGIQRTETFNAHSSDAGVQFTRAEVWCTFDFKLPSTNHTIRMHTSFYKDLGSMMFSFAEGDLGGAGYGTDWREVRYEEIMQYDFFAEAYREFYAAFVARIEAEFPGLVKP